MKILNLFKNQSFHKPALFMMFMQVNMKPDIMYPITTEFVYLGGKLEATYKDELNTMPHEAKKIIFEKYLSLLYK